MTLGELSLPFVTYATANSKPGSELPGYSQISLREKLCAGFDQRRGENVQPLEFYADASNDGMARHKTVSSRIQGLHPRIGAINPLTPTFVAEADFY